MSIDVKFYISVALMLKAMADFVPQTLVFLCKAECYFICLVWVLWLSAIGNDQLNCTCKYIFLGLMIVKSAESSFSFSPYGPTQFV